MFRNDVLTAGRITCILPTTPKNQRNSEGCFIRLKDNSILYAWSNFYSYSDDFGTTDIACIRSYDEGETWVERRVLQGDGTENLMCPSLIRMKNGDLGLFYVHHLYAKEDPTGGEKAFHQGRIMFTTSKDEGETWGEPKFISHPEQSFCFENGRAVRLASGRIILPTAYHAYEPDVVGGMTLYGVITFYVSDDDGETWTEVPQRLYGPSPEWTVTGLQEPMIYQTETGRLRCFMRTDLGCQYEADSDDEGMTWTTPMPNKNFTSPCSPMVIKRSGKYTVAVFNPVPNYLGRPLGNGCTDRQPMVVWTSENDGKTFTHLKMLDNRIGCQYPEIFDGGDYILIGYQFINEGVVAKLYHNELL
jgi:sialidase-1